MRTLLLYLAWGHIMVWLALFICAGFTPDDHTYTDPAEGA